MNRVLGTFLVLFGVSLIAALWFFFSAKSEWETATARFTNASTQLNRLERLAPYPSADNVREMKAHAEDYASALATLKGELKMRVQPARFLRPNEFQSQLRLALNAVADKARDNQVRLPQKFHLGFDDFVSALPTEGAASVLGQELGQIEWLVNGLLDAHVDGVTAFRRTPLPEENNSATPATSATSANTLFQRNVVEATFLSTPSAARKIINQIAGSTVHFCVIRVLHIRNEKDRGPAREAAREMGTANVSSSAAPTLNFIVGNEKIETTARIEFLSFTL